MDLAAAEWLLGHLQAALDGYLAVLAARPDQARAALNVGYLHYEAFATDAAGKLAHWPKARKAFLLYLQLVRAEDGYDHFERLLAVPFRLKAIEDALGADDGRPPSIADLR
jgi:hypothetical protein